MAQQLAEHRVRDALIVELRRAVAGQTPGADPLQSGRREPEPPATPPVPPTGRPISFNAAMARALLAGQKTQTRRSIRPLPTGIVRRDGIAWPAGRDGRALDCRLANVGDRLWVREPWAATARGTEYEADVGPAAGDARSWRAGRFMARSASRMTLHVTAVRPERLRDTSPTDAAAEGMPPGLFAGTAGEAEASLAWFRRLWDHIYGRDPDLCWLSNPWVWAITFRLVHANIDAKSAR